MINRLRRVGIYYICEANGYPCTQPKSGDLKTCKAWFNEFKVDQDNIGDLTLDINNWLKVERLDLVDIFMVLENVPKEQAFNVVESFLYSEQSRIDAVLRETLKNEMSKFVSCF